MKTTLSLLLLPFLLTSVCQTEKKRPPTPLAYPVSPKNKINGLTFVAPPEPFSQNPMLPIREVGANWIAVVPYAYTRPGTPSVRYNLSKHQWWGEAPEGVRESIRLAHEHGLKVMLKPQVYIPGSWTGALEFSSPEQWQAWEKDYEKYMLPLAQLADSLNVEMLCVGTEFAKSIEQRPEFWENLIGKTRKVFRGKLTYSSNWDDWPRVPFWDKLDYIGLGGYFPLVDATVPTVEQLSEAWQPIVARLREFHHQHKKPVLFTEYGYLSVEGCGWRNWELENDIESRPICEQAQANCLLAFHGVFQKEDWWAGSFLWKWFPNMRGHEGYPERDYTPQGKIGETILREIFKSQTINN